MAEEFREELIGISEKLGKYSSAMQESLNILSDEFLLLRDELSTLNQNLDKTKDLDSKLEEFNKTAQVLHGLQDKLKTLEKIADSLAIADQLGQKVDQLAVAVGSTKEKTGEAMNPLSKKMDLLFSKFEETLQPVNKKIDVMGEAFKEQLKETQESLNKEDQLKTLATTIQDEMNRMMAQYNEQNNAIKSISTSVAFLSSSEGELKKSVDGLIKIYEQDREKAAQEKSKLDPEAKRKADLKPEKIEEIIALLKVQMEAIQKQESQLENLKPQKTTAQAAQLEALAQELKKQNDSFLLLQKNLSEQTKMLALLKDSMPSGNFEEVIKHADVINQSTNTKLDSVVEMNNQALKAISTFNERNTQLPSLMQNVSGALDALVMEMKKSQTAYKNLETKVETISTGNAAGSAHIQQLESITQNIKGLHEKIDTKMEGSTTAPYDAQLKMVIEELRKFEALEQQRLEKAATVQQVTVTEPQAPKSDAQIISMKKDLATISANIEGLKNVLVQGTDITAEVDFSPVMKRLDLMQSQIAEMVKIAPVAGHQGVALSGSKLMDQRELLDEMQTNIRIFEGFELSDRAKLVVDRLETLVKRSIALYST